MPNTIKTEEPLEIKQSNPDLYEKTPVITFTINTADPPVELLRATAEGAVYVRGEKVDDNKLIYKALLEWMSTSGLLPKSV